MVTQGRWNPPAASALEQQQKTNEYVEFLPELRTMKTRIALLKYTPIAPTQ